jgi:hypothetical protein
MKRKASVRVKSSHEQTLCDAGQRFDEVLLSAACLDGRAAEPLDRDLTFFELW